MSADKSKNWFLRHKIISGIIVVFVLIIIAAATSDPKPVTTTDSTNQNATVEPVFDVPALIGKNIDEITAMLGKAEKDDEPTAEQLALGTKEWWKTYKKGNYELLVTYTPQDRSVIDFFIPAVSDNKLSQEDMEKLKVVGQVEKPSDIYSVELVKSLKDPSTFTGIKIIPQK